MVTPKNPSRTKSWTLAACILGSSLAYIDGSVVNVALPSMQADLGMSIDGAQWVVNGYLLLLGSLVLVGGAAGDRYGRRFVFILGSLVFTAATIVCAATPTPAFLIGARLVQGLGGAMLVPASMTIISVVFPEAERGKAIGTWAGASALTTALGPVLGGWLVDAASWRAIFYINVPIAAFAILIMRTKVPESYGASEDGKRQLDWIGGALAVIGLGALSYGLTTAAKSGWGDPTVYGVVILGLIGLAGFVTYEARATAPMVPLNLFRIPAFSGMNALTFLLYGALAGTFFLLPFDFIKLQGYSAAVTGASFLPFILVFGGLSRLSGGLINRIGARLPLIIGPALVAVAMALLAAPGIGGSYWTTFFPAFIVFGTGMALAIAPLTTIVIGAVDQRQAGVASGVNNAVARLGGLLAVAILGAVAVSVFGGELESRLSAAKIEPATITAIRAEAPRLANATVPASITGAMRATIETALKQSFLKSFRVAMLINAILALLSAGCSAVSLKRQKNTVMPDKQSEAMR
ncbi:MAG TPA: MFS transporter [Magnetospirillaceae bacterium]|jgi:EmrB/QacA subfamily drug resistance transporter